MSLFCGQILCALILLLQAKPAFTVRYIRVFPTPEEEAEKSQLGRMSYEERLAALRSLPREKKKRWAEFYRWFDTDLAWNDPNQPSNAWDQLLSLGDPITAEYLISQYRKFPDESLLQKFVLWSAPEAVPFFCEIADSTAQPPPEGYYGLGLSFTAAQMLFLNLRKAEYLPKDIRKWVAEMPFDYAKFLDEEQHLLEKALLEKRISEQEYKVQYGRIGQDAMLRSREVAKKWWHDNKEAFLAGRYSEVKPGGMISTAAGAPNKVIPGDQTPPGPAPPNPQSMDSKRAPNPTASPPEQAPTGNYVLFAATAAVLAAIILFAGIRLARKKPRVP